VINDSLGKTIAAASTKEVSKGSVMDKSLALGKIIAEKAVKSGVKQVVFDRGGFKYAGKVAAVARGAREAGLSF
jgi:large subunit ribosomal protein L18